MAKLKRPKLKSPLRGVPKNYIHDWNQRQRVTEKKVGPKTYLVKEVGYKKSRYPKKGTGPKPGSEYLWHWDRWQKTTKLSKNKYKVQAVSKKRLIKAKVVK